MVKQIDCEHFLGMATIADRYDAFILDVWGVLHDGVTLYPGVVDTLDRLTDASKPFVMLTNAPRRSKAVAEAMVEMGMPQNFCSHIVSSGEATYNDLDERSNPFYKNIGNRFFHTGPQRDRGLFEDLDWEETTTLEDCDLIVNTGPWRDGETISDYEDILRIGAQKEIPMICANPDLEVMRGGRKIICAGALAVRFTELGGSVRWLGKPKIEIYDYCFKLLEGVCKERIAAIGDSFRTDLVGARNAGIDPILVCGGIHSAEFSRFSSKSAAIEKLALEWKVMPVASMDTFTW